MEKKLLKKNYIREAITFLNSFPVKKKTPLFISVISYEVSRIFHNIKRNLKQINMFVQ